MNSQKHIAILGAGPGGYVAAIRASQLGAKVTIIENQALGGVCLNWGCIPSKALLSVVELGEKVKKAEELGIQIKGSLQYDVVQMVKRKDQVVANLVKGIGMLLKGGGVTHLQGTGTLIDNRTIHVSLIDGAETTVQADALIVATGSSWPNLPLFPIDGTRIITSKEALELKSIPERLLIIGGGVEGCEFASLYNGLGSDVSVVEMLPTLLSEEDEEISSLMAREFKKRRIQLYVETKVEACQVGDSEVTVKLSSGDEINTDVVLVSIGRRFNTEGIGLEQVGITLGTRGEITINDRMETNILGVYAIGDVVGKAMLAHVASAQGKVAVENILGRSQTVNYDVIPAGIFTLPEIGRVGLTEQQTRERGLQTKIGRFRYSGLGKAQSVGETAGLFKVISDEESGRLLGAHIIGAHATDLIHEAAMAIEVGATVDRLASMIHAHPTLSEGLMEAAEDVEGLAIHQAKKRV
ncbi:MAG: dihydrolipoyl dehydrogenase [Nitrospirales bacterium]|nr:MAG: dihydrolipoyl dehydrogenase [Nitrospirales bacterium]